MATADSLSVKYTLTDDDVVRASWAQLIPGGRKWLRLWIVPVALLGALYALLGNWAGFLQLLAIAAVLGVTSLLLPRYVKWTVRKSPHIGVEYELAASPDGLMWKTPHGNTELQWSAYTSAREAAEYFLFYSGAALCSTIPKRAFADAQDIGRFRELIRAQVPKTRLLDQPKTS